MKSAATLLIPALACATTLATAAPAKVTIAASRDDQGFATEPVPPPATNDAATNATFQLVAGNADPNSASLDVLHDGRIPAGEDEPSANFFLSGPARLRVDLGQPTDLASIATYSWHPGGRAGQVYEVYGAEGTEKDFKGEPAAGVKPESCGWTPLASVDTSSKRPGQHAALVSPSSGSRLGRFRYVLFDIKPNSRESGFNNTFFSEIDIAADGGPSLTRVEKPKRVTRDFASKDGKFKYTLDATEAPDMVDWCATHLIPVLDDWYPKIIAMLPVEGIEPAYHITFTLKNKMPPNMQGIPAYASGTSVVFNTQFMRDQQSGEAIGAGIHEVVHVVQFGGERTGARAERRGRGQGRGQRPPTWVTEGVADYIRWFLYEPQAKGAEITKNNVRRSKYDDSYRVTANFFDWVIKNHEKDLMRKLNVATHDGYSEELWKQWTGKTVQELGAEWKQANLERLGMAE